MFVLTRRFGNFTAKIITRNCCGASTSKSSSILSSSSNRSSASVSQTAFNLIARKHFTVGKMVEQKQEKRETGIV